MGDRVDAMLKYAREDGLMHEDRSGCASGIMVNLGAKLNPPLTKGELAKLCTIALKEEVKAGNAYKFYQDYIPDDLKGKIDPKAFQDAYFKASLDPKNTALEVKVKTQDGKEEYTFPLFPTIAYDAGYVEVMTDPKKLDPRARAATPKTTEILNPMCNSNTIPTAGKPAKPAIHYCNLAGQAQAKFDLEAAGVKLGSNDNASPAVPTAATTASAKPKVRQH